MTRLVKLEASRQPHPGIKRDRFAMNSIATPAGLQESRVSSGRNHGKPFQFTVLKRFTTMTTPAAHRTVKQLAASYGSAIVINPTTRI